MPFVFTSEAFLGSGAPAAALQSSINTNLLANSIQREKLDLAGRQLSIQSASLSAQVSQNRVNNEFKSRQLEAQQTQQQISNDRNEHLMRQNERRLGMAEIQEERMQNQQDFQQHLNQEQFDLKERQIDFREREFLNLQTQQDVRNQNNDTAMDLKLFQLGAVDEQLREDQRPFTFSDSTGGTKTVWMDTEQVRQAKSFGESLKRSRQKIISDATARADVFKLFGSTTGRPPKQIDIQAEVNKISDRLKLSDVIGPKAGDEFQQALRTAGIGDPSKIKVGTARQLLVNAPLPESSTPGRFVTAQVQRSLAEQQLIESPSQRLQTLIDQAIQERLPLPVRQIIERQEQQRRAVNAQQAVIEPQSIQQQMDALFGR